MNVLAENRRMNLPQVLFVLATGLIFSVEILLGLIPLNGAVVYRNFGIIRCCLATLGPVLMIGWVVWRVEGKGYGKWPLIGMLTTACFLLQISGTLAHPRGIGLVKAIILSPGATSYFNDALRISELPISGMAHWLGGYHQANLVLHGQSHPPGPIVFCWLCIKLLGAERAAWFCGFALGLAGALGVPVIYKFAGLWTTDIRARLVASAIYAMMPVLVFFFPEFDQIHAVPAMLMVLCWSKALASESGGWLKPAMLFGAVLFVASFFVYQIFAIGVFVIFFGIYRLWEQRWRGAAVGRLLLVSGAVIAVWAVSYGALWLATGYDPLASFVHAVNINRYYLGAALPANYTVYNLYVFAMGLGVMVVPIVLLHACRLFDRFPADPMDVPLTLMAVASILAIDLTRLFAGETDREWLFLAPLIAVPAGVEIARLSLRWRLAIFTMQGWILICMRAKISFIEF
jgi:hypothetical protein